MLSTYAGNKILDHVTGRAAWTMPSAVYFSIHSGNPGLTGANEHGYAGYIRQEVTWLAASDGVPAKNDGEVSFPNVAGSPITVSYIGIWDAETGGNFIIGFEIPERLIPVGSPPRIPDQAVEILALDNFTTYSKTKIVNHMLGIEGFTFPDNVYLAVIDDGAAEFASAGYARQLTDFDPAAAKEIANADEEDFGEADEDFGITNGFILFDAITDGNALLFGDWDTPTEILTGDGYLVPDGGITITAV